MLLHRALPLQHAIPRRLEGTVNPLPFSGYTPSCVKWLPQATPEFDWPPHKHLTHSLSLYEQDTTARSRPTTVSMSFFHRRRSPPVSFFVHHAIGHFCAASGARRSHHLTIVPSAITAETPSIVSEALSTPLVSFSLNVVVPKSTHAFHPSVGPR
jgi:hypothetical protein